jgi:DNA-binding NtrC family response regulator
MESLIALIDTATQDGRDMVATLTDWGYGLRTVGSLDEFAGLMTETDFRIALIDLDSFPAGNRFFRDMRALRPDLRIFVVSARPFHPELSEAMSRHICACFRKPPDPDEVLSWLKAVCHHPPAPDPTGRSPG